MWTIISTRTILWWSTKCHQLKCRIISKLRTSSSIMGKDRLHSSRIWATHQLLLSHSHLLRIHRVPPWNQTSSRLNPNHISLHTTSRDKLNNSILMMCLTFSRIRIQARCHHQCKLSNSLWIIQLAGPNSTFNSIRWILRGRMVIVMDHTIVAMGLTQVELAKTIWI